jgi:hypothetical protein
LVESFVMSEIATDFPAALEAAGRLATKKSDPMAVATSKLFRVVRSDI